MRTGQDIYIERKRRRISQGRFARMVGESTAHNIGVIERMNLRLPDDLLARIKEALDAFDQEHAA